MAPIGVETVLSLKAKNEALRRDLDEAVGLLRAFVDTHDATFAKLSDHAKAQSFARETHPHGHNENPNRKAARAFLERISQ